METTVKLELQFASEEGKTRTLSVSQPALDLDPTLVEEAMNNIAAQGLFEQEGIKMYDKARGARYITRGVEDIYQVAEV